MVEIGSVIQARVERIEPFGIFLKHGEEPVLVLLPEVSWAPFQHPSELAQIGDTLDVYVLRYNYPERTIVGSLKKLHPEDNPFRKLARLEPGTVLRGRVRATYGDDVLIQLPNAICGYIPKNRLRTVVAVGDEIEATIASLEVDEGRLTLDLVRKLAESTRTPPIPVAMTSPTGVTP